VREGCLLIGAVPGQTAATVRGVREVWPGFLVVKLTPSADPVPVASAAQEAGADAVSLVNTFKGLVLDRASLRPYLGGGTGGLSGPAIRPLALRMVYEVAAAVEIPLIAMGGVADVADVLDFVACGATAVAVGAAAFRDPWLYARLMLELGEELSLRGMTLAEARRCAHRS
jgi:dihydroorotate dehydrogenase (NAD+) catalytic subunit